MLQILRSSNDVLILRKHCFAGMVGTCDHSPVSAYKWRKPMAYYLAVTLPSSFDEAIQKAEVALQAEGFGIISRIDLQDAFKTKIGVDFRPYTILGACNPKLAYEALQFEDKVGTMLPCNVVVQEIDGQHTEVAAIDPVASMQAIENADLTGAAGEVRAKLARVIESLEAGIATSV
jgi:uncharacterized protein (DUF302 family)